MDENGYIKLADFGMAKFMDKLSVKRFYLFDFIYNFRQQRLFAELLTILVPKFL